MEETINWQRTSKKAVNIGDGKEILAEFQHRLKEAQEAKAVAGEKWGCNPSVKDQKTVEEKEHKKNLIIYEVRTPSPAYSFISTDELMFRAKVEGFPEINKKIFWKSEDGKVDQIDSSTLNPANFNGGPDYSIEPPLKPRPPEALNGRNGRLSYKIIAIFNDGNDQSQASVLIRQDKLDQLRQEYVDMGKKIVPNRGIFIKGGGIYNTGDYAWAIASASIKKGYEVIAKNYAPYPARINSGYRNPVRNFRVGGQKESRHIYGDALDIQTVSIGHSGPPNKRDWSKLVEIVRTIPGSWIEPFEQSKAGHVHVDWRSIRKE